MQFLIIELEDGYTVVELPDGLNAADVAAQHGGTVADDGPFDTYEEAVDALAEFEEDTHEAGREG